MPKSSNKTPQKGAHTRSNDVPKYRGVWYALLALFLIVPFLLREVSPQLEAYPAILFPVGASVTNVGDTVLTYPVVEVFAVMPDDSEKRIQPNDFLGRIPVQYFGPLVKKRFGLEPHRYQTRWSNWFGREKVWTDEEHRMTMVWIASRAQAAGYPNAWALRFRTSSKTVAIGTGKVLQSRVQDSYDLIIDHE